MIPDISWLTEAADSGRAKTEHRLTPQRGHWITGDLGTVVGQ
jgi:hypothetical protein